MQDREAYAAHFRLTRQRDPAFLRRWMERIADAGGRGPAELPQRPWLDAGAGTGRFCAALVDFWSRDVVALEPEAVMVAAREGHPRVRWVQGDALELPVQQGAFAGVWCHLVLHQIPTWRRAVSRLASAVADGGVFAARTVDPDAPGTLIHVLFPEAHALDRRRLMPATAIAQAMEQAGLRTVVRRYADPRERPRDTVVAQIEGRSLSTLQLIDDAAFHAGLARLHERFPAGSPPIRDTEHGSLVVGLR